MPVPVRAASVALALVLVAVAARAQTPAAAADEPIEPDRPDVTNGTHIVDIGLVQVELGGVFTRAAANQRAYGSPVTFRFGLVDWLEARVGTDGVLVQSISGSVVDGVGNVQLGAKLRLWADPGGIPVLSILPTINLPTASATKGLGTGDPDYTLVVLTGTDFWTRGHVDLNYGIGAIGAGGGRPHYVQHLVSVSASMAAGNWNPYAEVYWFSRQDIDGGGSTSMDAGAIYTVSPRLAIDGGWQLGLSHAAPDFTAFGGVSIVVGNIMGQHGVHARQRRAQARARAPRE